MKELIDIKRFRFYGWLGLVFSIMGSLYYLHILPEKFREAAINNVWTAAYVTICNYILFEYTLPRLNSRKIFPFVLRMVVHIFFYSWGLYLWRFMGIQLHIYTALGGVSSVSHSVAKRMEYSVESILFFSVVKHFYDHIKLKQAAQKLRIEKQAAELNYLKSQTNPHFLFNTLNNIYSLARDKSDLAPESILRLSKILRFMLYETGGEYIAIEQELKIITDYIALEKLRYDESLHINFNHDIENMKQALPPLLLIPLVENAFKHGVSETRGRPFIDIHLSVNQRKLVFVVKNSAEDFQGDGGIKENIGLSNLRRQLELLYTDYNLSVKHDASVFTANLQINLASHV